MGSTFKAFFLILNPWLTSWYIQVSDVLCYKPIPVIYRTSMLQNSLKVIIMHIMFYALPVKFKLVYLTTIEYEEEFPSVIWKSTWITFAFIRKYFIAAEIQYLPP